VRSMLRPSGSALRKPRRLTAAGAPRTSRPRGRRTGPHGVARASRGSGAVSSAGTGSALPASRFGGDPVFPIHSAGREPSSATVPLVASRSPSGHAGGSTPTVARPATPSWALGPLQRLRHRGFGRRGLAEPATFRPQRFSRSRRFTPRDTCPGLFHPGNAPGVPSSGLCAAREAPTSLEVDCSPAVRPTVTRVKLITRARSARLQSLAPPGLPHRAGRNPSRPVPS